MFVTTVPTHLVTCCSPRSRPRPRPIKHRGTWLRRILTDKACTLQRKCSVTTFAYANSAGRRLSDPPKGLIETLNPFPSHIATPRRVDIWLPPGMHRLNTLSWDGPAPHILPSTKSHYTRTPIYCQRAYRYIGCMFTAM